MYKQKHIVILARDIRPGGVQRFLYGVLGALIQRTEVRVTLITDAPESFSEYTRLPIVHLRSFHKLWWDYVAVVPILRHVNPDVVLYIKNIIPTTHLFVPAKKVNVIHDLASFEPTIRAYPFFDTLYMRLSMKISCWVADRIYAVSESTKSDIIKRLHVSDKKISVLLEGVDRLWYREVGTPFAHEVLERYHIQQPYLLYCGSISPRKNLKRLLEAYVQLLDIIPHHLFICTEKSWGDADVRSLVHTHADRIHTRSGVDDHALRVLYSHADLFLYPSLYEGFGLPIIEAQSCGCPVLTSNVSSCPEVVGEGGLCVDPQSVDAIRDGMHRIIEQPDYRRTIVERGYVNAQQYRWEDVAVQLIQTLP